MLPETALTLIIVVLLGIVSLESYFLYKLSTMVAVLNAAPDAESARILLKTVKAKPPAPPKKRGPPEVSPGDISDEGIANLRILQDENGR